MNKQEIIETLQEITGMAMMLGLSNPDQIQPLDGLFSFKFGGDVMNAFYQTLATNKAIRDKITQALENAETVA